MLWQQTVVVLFKPSNRRILNYCEDPMLVLLVLCWNNVFYCIGCLSIDAPYHSYLYSSHCHECNVSGTTWSNFIIILIIIIIVIIYTLWIPLGKFLWTGSPLKVPRAWGSVSCPGTFNMWPGIKGTGSQSTNPVNLGFFCLIFKENTEITGSYHSSTCTSNIYPPIDPPAVVRDLEMWSRYPYPQWLFPPFIRWS